MSRLNNKEGGLCANPSLIITLREGDQIEPVTHIPNLLGGRVPYPTIDTPFPK